MVRLSEIQPRTQVPMTQLPYQLSREELAEQLLNFIQANNREAYPLNGLPAHRPDALRRQCLAELQH